MILDFIIVSDDFYFLMGMKNGITIKDSKIHTVFFKNSEMPPMTSVSKLFQLVSNNTLMLISVQDSCVLIKLINLFYNKVKLCILPPSLRSKRDFFYQHSVCYFNKRKTMNELKNILLCVYTKKNNLYNIISDKEFLILNLFITKGSTKKTAKLVGVSEKTISHYKLSAFQKMGLMSNQDYFHLHLSFLTVLATRKDFFNSGKPDTLQLSAHSYPV
ncbi:hypothetical protein LC76_19395 [Salmonella enterica]|nr:hypothetical protein [Salmonella enterica]EBM9478518.1 hypothetical protein [Salmonella enterica subsp. enterica serovar Rubislaw]ECT6468334.1 hypothetical protein [Salmonella enterica subsp. enterica serovar Senegal]EBO3245431.1 hypothetical protein [Salmonella enterica subsp. enterica serovar Rubislaw]EBT5148874.1 hypothetical protein [Salmonella enterica]